MPADFRSWPGVQARFRLALLVAFVAVLWPLGATLSASNGETRSELKRIRTKGPRISQALEEGIIQSATLRNLVDRLEDSDLIVHIIPLTPSTGPIGGEMQFATATPGARYLQIKVQQGLQLPKLIAMIGHELQHAVEVAEAPQVIDQQSLSALYDTIGYRPDRGRRETRMARDTGVRVLREVTVPSQTLPRAQQYVQKRDAPRR